jgi:hypothetical protein
MCGASAATPTAATIPPGPSPARPMRLHRPRGARLRRHRRHDDRGPILYPGWNRYSFMATLAFAGGGSPLNLTDPAATTSWAAFAKPASKAIGKSARIGTSSCRSLQRPAQRWGSPALRHARCHVRRRRHQRRSRQGLSELASSRPDGGRLRFRGTVTAGNFIANIAGHAAAGCLSALASGGNCKSGAMAASLSAAATPFIEDTLSVD